jgi:hypothetical protein
MNRTISKFLLGGLCLTFLFSGCTKKKDDLLNTTPQTNTTPTVSFSFSNASGVLVALKTVTQQTVAGIVLPVELNTPTAAFPAPLGSSTFVDAGTITFNSKSLAKLTNNSYVYSDYTNPVYYDNITWAVSGSSSIPAINYTEDKLMPAYSDYSSMPSTVTKTAGLTVNFGGSLSNADSVYVVVISAGNSKMVLKRASGSGTACVFTADDLSILGAGAGYLEVCPWNYKLEDISSKSFYFILESAYVKSITIN